MALGGLPPIVSSVFDQINGKPAAGLYASGLIGMSSQHPAAREWLHSRLKTTGPANATGFWEAGRLDGFACVERFKNRDIHEYFVNGRDDLHAPVMEAMFAADGVMGVHGTPRMPTFVYKAVHDELSPVGETDDLVRKHCRNGARIIYHRNRAGDHQSEVGLLLLLPVWLLSEEA
jgi:secretory lipase